MSEYCEGLVIDLHNHSNKSDGLYSPSEVVRKAYDAGIRVFGLSDHDNVSGMVADLIHVCWGSLSS